MPRPQVYDDDKPICGWKTKVDVCRRPPTPGSTRCKRHAKLLASQGERNPPALTPENHEKMKEGAARWRQRRKELLEAGLIVPQAVMPRSPDSQKATALAIIDATKLELAQGEDSGLAAQFDRVLGLGLDRIEQLLRYGGRHPKIDVLYKQSEVSLGLIRVAVKHRQDMLQHQRADRLLSVMELWAQEKEKPQLIDAETVDAAMEDYAT